MAKIASLHMAANKSVSGSIVKACASADASVTITEISYGESITNPNYPAERLITASSGQPWNIDTTDFEIAAGQCLDCSGIAAFKTGNGGDDTPIVYYRVGHFDGPN